MKDRQMECVILFCFFVWSLVELLYFLCSLFKV